MFVSFASAFAQYESVGLKILKQIIDNKNKNATLVCLGQKLVLIRHFLSFSVL